MKAFLHHYVLLGIAFVLAFFKDKLHIDTSHVTNMHGLIGIFMVAISIPAVQAKLKAIGEKLAGISSVPKLLILGVLALAVEGCALTPQQIQTDTAIGTNLGLNGAVIFDKVKAPEIQADAVQVAQALDQVVIPTFQSGATTGQLLASSVSQAMLHLQTRLASLKHGPEIIGIISLLQVPLTGALGGTASPTALLSPNARANALAFFTGVRQGIGTFTSVPAGPAPPPAPQPAPVPK